MMEGENHRLKNTTVIIIAYKNHQLMLKWAGTSMVRNRIFT